jgi:hypothetical protein
MGSYCLPIIFCVCFIVCASCDSDSNVKKQISLFDGHTYVLVEGEKEMPKDAAAVSMSNELKTVFNKEQLILFKYVHHKDYDTYLFIDLDSTINKGHVYKTKKIANKKTIFYQHMVDPESEITGITVLRKNKFTNRFSQDSLSKKRFVILNQKHEAK